MDGFEQDTVLIRALVSFSNLAPATLAKRAGIAASTVNRPYNGAATTRLGRAALEKLQAAFPDFPGWDQDRLADRRLSFEGFEPKQDPDVIELDHIDLNFGLGGTYLDGPVETEKRPFSRALLRHFTRSAPEHLFWALGDGDSMEPTIRSGELMLIDRSHNTPRMDDAIWACARGEMGMVKRLRFLNDGTVEIHSDNEKVRPALAADGELHIIGRVVAIIRKL